MIYKLKEQKDKFIEKVYKESMKDLSRFYGIQWTYGKPYIIIVKNRKEIDRLKDIKTERWLEGWSNGKSIYVLDRKNLEKESSHKYTEETYSAFLKHEISHTFYSIISKGKTSPKWLCEGVAIYTSGQNKFKKIPTKFENFLDFYENGGSSIYYESGFVMELLVKKYGRGKLLKLISKLNTVRNKDEFYKLFKSIYSFPLNYNKLNSLLNEIKFQKWSQKKHKKPEQLF